MNKKYIDYVIVVEGASDKSKILSLFDAYVVVTNGYDINEPLLKLIAKHKKILLLTDPDEAGKQIRDKINNIVSCVNVEVNPKECDKHHKHGVAECSKEELLKVLKPYVSSKVDKALITNNDLYLLNINRDKLIEGLGLSSLSNKQLIDIINIVGLTKEDLKKYAD